MKTNGARFLESLGIPFELREYEVDENDLSAIAVAKKDRHARRAGLQNAADHRRSRRSMSSPSFPATPSWTSRNSRAPPGWRKAEMAPLKDVQPLTGYIRGGVTIFGAKKPYPGLCR